MPRPNNHAGSKRRFHLLHGFDFGRRELQLQKMRFALAQPVFGRNGAAQRHGVAREFNHEQAGAGAIVFRFRQDVDVHVRVADVSENHVAAGEAGFEAGAGNSPAFPHCDPAARRDPS